MALRENGTNASIAAGEFDASAIVQLAGSSRSATGGTLVVRSVGVRYPREQAGKAATLTYTVRVRDDRGNDLSRRDRRRSHRDLIDRQHFDWHRRLTPRTRVVGG